MSQSSEIYPPSHDNDDSHSRDDEAEHHLEDDDGFSNTTTSSGGRASSSLLPSDLSEEEEGEDESCPLCMEPLAATGKDFDPCKCGHKQQRVLQRNLMYCINIPPSLAKEEVLAERRYFGKFGKLSKIKVAATRKVTTAAATTSSSSSLSSSKLSSSPASTSSSVYSAYVTFKRPSDCAVAISLCHHTILLGHTLKATYGTTKYCAFYTRGVPCTMTKCSYLHEPAKPEDVVGKEELAAMERLREHEKATPFPLQLTVAEAVAAAKAVRAVQHAQEVGVAEGKSSTSPDRPRSLPIPTTSSTSILPSTPPKEPSVDLPAPPLYSVDSLMRSIAALERRVERLEPSTRPSAPVAREEDHIDRGQRQFEVYVKEHAAELKVGDWIGIVDDDPTTLKVFPTLEAAVAEHRKHKKRFCASYQGPGGHRRKLCTHWRTRCERENSIAQA